jgi:hypothetical protein
MHISSGVHQLRVKAAFVLGAMVLLYSESPAAKTLYVDANAGNDATSWAANGPSAPWRTIGRAAWGSASRGAPNPSEAARAGDVVMIATGTYASSLDTGAGRYDVLYNPVNNGTTSEKITFVANGTVAVRAPSWGGPVIGARLVNNIVWRGPFLIDESYIRTVPDTGPVVFSSSSGSGIDGATIRGNGAPWADNHVGVRTDSCNQCFIRNTTIDNFYSQTGFTRNGAAVMIYDSDDLLIEQNEFSNCGTGIYIKGTTIPSPIERTTVRFNVIRNMDSSGVNVQRTQDARIYQNIIRDNNIGIRVGGTELSYDHPVNDVIANNVVDGGGVGVGVYFGGIIENLRFRNNIFTSVAQVHLAEGGFTAVGSSHENNIYHSVSGTFASISGANYTLSSWKSSLGFDRAAPESLNTDPRFVDAAGNNFRLRTDSPGRTLGVDRLDLDRDGSMTDTIPVGAYVTGDEVIGVATGVATARPGAPADVIVE